MPTKRPEERQGRAGAPPITSSLQKTCSCRGSARVAQGPGSNDHGDDRNILSSAVILRSTSTSSNGAMAVFGAEAAARYHFGITAAALGPEQAARLAAMVPSPRRYVPGRETAYLQRRVEIIQSRMNAAQLP